MNYTKLVNIERFFCMSETSTLNTVLSSSRAPVAMHMPYVLYITPVILAEREVLLEDALERRSGFDWRR